MQRKSDLTPASSLGVRFSGSHEGNRPTRGQVRCAGSRGGAPRPPAVSSQPCLTSLDHLHGSPREVNSTGACCVIYNRFVQPLAVCHLLFFVPAAVELLQICKNSLWLVLLELLLAIVVIRSLLSRRAPIRTACCFPSLHPGVVGGIN